MRLDNRITLGGFKKEIETLINVHRDYFKILKIYTSNQVGAVILGWSNGRGAVPGLPPQQTKLSYILLNCVSVFDKY